MLHWLVCFFFFFEQTYDCCVGSHGSPLADMSLGAKPCGKPRLPFVISPVVDGGTTGAVGDEFVSVNSFCRSHDEEDRPEEGESTAAQSSLHVPDPSHDSNLGLETGAVPHDRCILIDAVKPPNQNSQPPKSMAADRIQKAGVPHAFCRRTQHHLRQRQQRTESSLREAL